MEMDDDLYRQLENYARKLMSGPRWLDSGREIEPRDLVQDAIVGLLAAERRGTEVLNTAAWLTSTIRNRVRDLARKSLRKGMSERMDVEVSDELQDSRCTSPEAAAGLAEWKAAVTSAIQGLPERQREVIRLYVKGLSVSEIAQRLGITADAVRQGLFKARRRLEPYLSWMAV